jgi:hypothetical protein
MRRSGALTLGVILTLGGATGGRGQELSGSVAEASATSWPSPGGLALPALPENWADLPFRLTASQTTSYNSNINAIPLGFAVPPGQVRGDFTSTTNFGFSTKANVYGQKLYFDASFGVIRYLHQTSFDSNVYTVSAGDNWTLTSRCAGNLGVTLSKSPAAITELVATGVNYVTSTALNETGNCAVSNGFSLLFNSSLTRDTNSNPIDAVNNTRTAMIEAGIEYAKGPSTLTVLAGVSDTNYTDRTAATTALGLATEVDFHRFTLSYTRQINPNLSVTGLIGLVGVTNAFTLGLPKTLLPVYTLSASWAFTPKLTLTASGSRTIAPPTTIIANAEISYDATMNLTYQVTPKVGLTLGGSAGYSTGAFTPGVTGAVLSPFFVGASNFYTATAGLTYAMTPFLSAGLSASYTERVGDHLITPQDLVMVNLNYRPY